MADSEDLVARVATPDDAAAVSALLGGFRDSFAETEPADASISRSVERLLADPDTEFLLAGEPPAGLAQLRFRWSVWREAPDAWLEDLYVEPDSRRSGLGRALAEASLDSARRRGAKRIQLDCNEGNEGALALYESLGFSSRPARWDGGRDLYLTLAL